MVWICRGGMFFAKESSMFHVRFESEVKQDIDG